MALTESFLFTVARVNHSEVLSFFIYPTDSLSSFSPNRQQVLTDLQAKTGEVEEIDGENKWIIVKNSRNMEVWDIESGRMIHSLPVWHALYCKYSNAVVTVCVQDQDVLNISVHYLKSGNVASLSVPNGSVPYHCEVIRGSLVLGMEKREMIVVNLESFHITRVGVIKRFYEFEDFDDGFALLNDGSGVFISNPLVRLHCGKIGRIFVNNAGTLLVYSKQRNAVLVLDPARNVKSVALERNDKVQVLGFSAKSQTFFVGKKHGLISVFE